jgi:hypothetical protein
MYGNAKKKDAPKQPRLKVKIKASGNAATRLLNRLGVTQNAGRIG